MTTKNTVVADKSIRNLRKDVRALMFHAKVAQLMGVVVLRSIAKGTLRGEPIVNQFIVPQTQRLCARLETFERTFSNVNTITETDEALLGGINKGISLESDEVCNIAEVTELIGEGNKDYNERILFAVNGTWQTDILRKYWLAAGGTRESFESYHGRQVELVY